MNNFKLNKAGVRELMRSAEMKEVIEEFASQVQQQCGNGYGTLSYTAETRAGASVFTDTDEAYQDNLDNNTLLRVIGR